jgi:hypothetical protein
VLCPPHLMALRSRLPHRSTSLLGPETDRPVYMVSFQGGSGRVRNPSRKNTALDLVGGGGGSVGRASTEGLGQSPPRVLPLLDGAEGAKTRTLILQVCVFFNVLC